MNKPMNLMLRYKQNLRLAYNNKIIPSYTRLNTYTIPCSIRRELRNRKASHGDFLGLQQYFSLGDGGQLVCICELNRRGGGFGHINEWRGRAGESDNFKYQPMITN